MAEHGREALKGLVARFRPRRILVVGPAGRALVDDYLQAHPECSVDTLAAEVCSEAALAGRPRYDLAIVSHTLEHLPEREAGALIAALRDIHSRRLLAVVPLGPHWPGHRTQWEMTDLLGYGLVEVGGFLHDGRPVGVYAFDIATYKLTPDWLNSRYWAHPELWDRYWW